MRLREDHQFPSFRVNQPQGTFWWAGSVGESRFTFISGGDSKSHSFLMSLGCLSTRWGGLWPGSFALIHGLSVATMGKPVNVVTGTARCQSHAVTAPQLSPSDHKVGEPWLHSLTYSTRMGILAGMVVCHKASSVDQSVTQFRLVQRNANRNQEQTIYDS